MSLSFSQALSNHSSRGVADPDAVGHGFEHRRQLATEVGAEGGAEVEGRGQGHGALPGRIQKCIVRRTPMAH